MTSTVLPQLIVFKPSSIHPAADADASTQILFPLINTSIWTCVISLMFTTAMQTIIGTNQRTMEMEHASVS